MIKDDGKNKAHFCDIVISKIRLMRDIDGDYLEAFEECRSQECSPGCWERFTPEIGESEDHKDLMKKPWGKLFRWWLRLKKKSGEK